MIKLIRRSGALFTVIGAGASITAGCPSWTELVRRLLNIALDEGRKVYTYERIKTGDSVEVKAHLVEVIRLKKDAVVKAKGILSKIEAGSTDTELLMEGAQLCADFFQESLFQQITIILYPGGDRKPSDVHRAIANLAHTQNAIYRGLYPGWVSIINYNFDSLMNDTLDEEHIHYTLSFMRNQAVTRFQKREESENDKSLPVLHLHGFIPRQPFFDIKGIDYVFSTEQYAIFYQGQPTIIDHVVTNYISNPMFVGLYVGCSFTDQKMNALLQEAATRYPGRLHYALLSLPEDLRERNAPGLL